MDGHLQVVLLTIATFPFPLYIRASQLLPSDSFISSLCFLFVVKLCLQSNSTNAIGLGQDRSLIWVEGDAEALKFEDDSMDGYTIAFGIRNVTHIEKALAEAYRYAVNCIHDEACFC